MASISHQIFRAVRLIFVVLGPDLSPLCRCWFCDLDSHPVNLPQFLRRGLAVCQTFAIIPRENGSSVARQTDAFQSLTIRRNLVAVGTTLTNFPHGSFGSVFNTGVSLNAGLEYILQRHLSLEGIFGYHHFPSSLLGDLNVYQFSVNGKTYLTNGKIRPFVNGGIGGYEFSPGSTYFGGNFGGGILFNLTSRFGLQGSYNFHVVDTTGAAAKWSDAQAGLRVEF